VRIVTAATNRLNLQGRNLQQASRLTPKSHWNVLHQEIDWLLSREATAETAEGEQESSDTATDTDLHIIKFIIRSFLPKSARDKFGDELLWFFYFFDLLRLYWFGWMQFLSSFKSLQ
jgi:hypothetical protein